MIAQSQVFIKQEGILMNDDSLDILLDDLDYEKFHRLYLFGGGKVVIEGDGTMYAIDANAWPMDDDDIVACVRCVTNTPPVYEYGEPGMRANGDGTYTYPDGRILTEHEVYLDGITNGCWDDHIEAWREWIRESAQE